MTSTKNPFAPGDRFLATVEAGSVYKDLFPMLDLHEVQLMFITSVDDEDSVIDAYRVEWIDPTVDSKWVTKPQAQMAILGTNRILLGTKGHETTKNYAKGIASGLDKWAPARKENLKTHFAQGVVSDPALDPCMYYAYAFGYNGLTTFPLGGKK